MELDDLEKMWEQAWENEEDEDNDNGEKLASLADGKEAIGPTQQQQTMDMGLFYGSIREHNHYA